MRKLLFTIALAMSATVVGAQAPNSGHGSLASTNAVTYIQGSPSLAPHRVQMIVMGDGFQSSDMSSVYPAAVSDFVTALFSKSPLAEYAPYFNIVRVNVISTDSGVTICDQSTQVAKDTYFGVTYGTDSGPEQTVLSAGNCTANAVGQANATQVAMVADENRIATIMSQVTCNSLLTTGCVPNSASYGVEPIYVLLAKNSSKSGGAVFLSSKLMLSSIDTGMSAMVPHLAGHLLGRLRDEYDVAHNTCGPYNSTVRHPNTTDDPITLPWAGWVSSYMTGYMYPSTTVSSYSGADDCDDYYRPTSDSLMNTISATSEFYQVNTEQIIKGIYRNLGSFPDGTASPSQRVTTSAGSNISFTVATPGGTSSAPAAGYYTLWYLYNGSSGTGLSSGYGSSALSQTVNTTGFAPGVYQVVAYVFDLTTAGSGGAAAVQVPQANMTGQPVTWTLDVDCADTTVTDVVVDTLTSPFASAYTCTQETDTTYVKDCNGNVVGGPTVLRGPIQCSSDMYDCTESYGLDVTTDEVDGQECTTFQYFDEVVCESGGPSGGGPVGDAVVDCVPICT